MGFASYPFDMCCNDHFTCFRAQLHVDPYNMINYRRMKREVDLCIEKQTALLPKRVRPRMSLLANDHYYNVTQRRLAAERAARLEEREHAARLEEERANKIVAEFVAKVTADNTATNQSQIVNNRLSTVSQVVDARAGPGVKSFSKTRNKRRAEEDRPERVPTKRTRKNREPSPALSEKSDNGDEDDVHVPPTSPADERKPRKTSNLDESVRKNRRRRRKMAVPKKRSTITDQHQLHNNTSINNYTNDFIDRTYWKEEPTCCGIIYKGKNNEIIIDDNRYHPCSSRLALNVSNSCSATTSSITSSCTTSQQQRKSGKIISRRLAVTSTITNNTNDLLPNNNMNNSTSNTNGCQNQSKLYCDTSSDSGYEDSSHGMAMSPENLLLNLSLTGSSGGNAGSSSCTVDSMEHHDKQQML